MEMIVDAVNAACFRYAWRRLVEVVPIATGNLVFNPFSGGYFTREDDVFDQVMTSIPAVRAVLHFGRSAPSGRRLPINRVEREALEASGDPRLLLWCRFAVSLAASDFDYELHPSFPEYASGFLAVHDRRWRLLEKDRSLASEFPPKSLPGLSSHSTVWRPS